MHEPPPIVRLEDPKLEAIVEVMILAASVDGEFSSEERAELLTNLESLTSRKLEPAALDATIGHLEGALAVEGREARLSTLAQRLGDAPSRKVALDLAIEIMLADGVLRTSERELLLEVAEALDLDRGEIADRIKARVG